MRLMLHTSIVAYVANMSAPGSDCRHGSRGTGMSGNGRYSPAMSTSGIWVSSMPRPKTDTGARTTFSALSGCRKSGMRPTSEAGPESNICDRARWSYPRMN
jgi:hypothetical protein